MNACAAACALVLVLVAGAGAASAQHGLAWETPEQGDVAELLQLKIFHSNLINTGAVTGNYRVTMTVAAPPAWVTSMCEGTFCYAPFVREFDFPQPNGWYYFEKDPKTGLEHVAAFYETDEWVFNHYDDSSGTIGDVYRYNARDLFILYASRCPDKEWVANLVLRLYQHDGYGVRDRILECSGQYLPEAVMRGMVDRLWAMAKEKAEKYSDLRATSGIEALAKELKDPKLFEKARRAGWPKLNSAACVDIAQAYFEADDARTALSWLERIPAEDVFKARERDKLLAEVYEKLGDQDKRQEVAWRIFRSGRSKEALVSLLEVIGEAERDKVIEGEAASILSSERLSYSDGWFLMQVGRVDEAEKYLLDRAARLDGDHYQSLLPLAQGMEKHGRALVASVIYRALIDSTMRRAQAKYYHHAVRYLKILERLAPGIADWRGFEPHSEYMVEFREAHKRKTSLWARYSE
ncbi:MAG: hypothetical protein C4555_04330 [Dehalococcoidia bacterium]|nr:MAG: hypothetical protein C4555_04330 [Dehalococcoidia bacterium]